MKNNFKKIVTIIQARTGSGRLPGKVMMTAAGKPLLLLMLERVQRAALAGEIVIATTIEKKDDIIADLCESENINYYRGHPLDLLERHYEASLFNNADIVLKIPSDCPLIDPEIIDNVIEYYLINEDKYDYVSNLHPATYPDGNDVEVFSFNVLHQAYKDALKDYEREHTTPYIWNNPHKFSIGNYLWEAGINYSESHRFVLDYPEDYEFIKTVYEELYNENSSFTLNDILDLVERKPEIQTLNKHFIGKNWYKNYTSDLNNANNFKSEIWETVQVNVKNGF